MALADTSVARTVSNFDAELRLVAAGLGGSVIPRQVAARSEKLHRICVIALTDAWAKRRLAIRAPETLSAAASRMVEFLASKVD